MRKIINGIVTGILILLLTFTMFLVTNRFLGNSSFIVLSGSMEPTYKVGSLIFTKPVSFASLKEGDTITFESQGPSKKVVTHRIIEINQQKELVSTQGDANKTPDAHQIPGEGIIGKVSFAIPYIGYGLAFFQSKIGNLLMLLIALFLLSGYVIRYFFKGEKTSTVRARP